MPATQDTEITLGTGKMLALFFGLVALCAAFFGMGFKMGRNSVTPAISESVAAPAASNPGMRPSAVKAANNAGASPSADVAFYKSGGQRAAAAGTNTSESNPPS